MSVVLITGASRGIGAACAREFAAIGCDVAVHYHSSREQAEAVCAELGVMGVRAMTACADVSRSDDVGRMIAAVNERLGGIDVLVNNAGIAQQLLLTDTTDEDWRRMVDTDLSSVFYGCRAVLPQMIRRHSGCIINIASMWGEVGASCEVAYSAAKAGVIGLTKALAKEVGPSGVRVNAISPGVIMTDMMAGYSDDDVRILREEAPLNALGSPQDIAHAAVYLASDQARFITGQVLSVNGGIVI